MEKKTIKVMKTIPVDSVKQIKIKVTIPFVLSFASFVITIMVLLFGKVISPSTSIFALIVVTLLLVTYFCVSLIEELSIRNNKIRSTFKSSLIAYALPLVYFIVVVVLSYFRMNIYLVHLIGVLLMVLSGIYPMIYCIKNEKQCFY